MKFKDFVAKDYVGAGFVFITPDKKVLLLKKENGKWTFPGGHREEGETPLDTAKRESIEEIGLMPAGEITTKIVITKQEVKKPVYSFFMRVKEPFVPTLSFEHKDYKWISVLQIDKKKLTNVFQPFWSLYKKIVTEA